MLMMANIYIAGKTSTDNGVQLVRDSVVWVARCRSRVSVRETTAVYAGYCAG